MGVMFQYVWTYDTLYPVRNKYKKNVIKEIAAIHHHAVSVPIVLDELNIKVSDKLFYYYVEVKENKLIERFSLDNIDYSNGPDDDQSYLEIESEVKDKIHIMEYVKKLGVLLIQETPNQKSIYATYQTMQDIGSRNKELDGNFYVYFYKTEKEIRFQTENKNFMYFTPEIELLAIETKEDFEILQEEIKKRKKCVKIIKEVMKKERLNFLFQ
jgi:hypothetical protein